MAAGDVLKVGFLNACSLKKHAAAMKEYLLEEKVPFDLFGIAETRLGDLVGDNLVEVDGYTLLRQDRNEQGGGVGLYVKEGIKARELATSNTKVTGKPCIPEYIFYEIQVGGSLPILVAVVYRPPDNPSLRKTTLPGLLRGFCSEYSHKIIMGDFNVNMLNSESDSVYLRKLASELSLSIVPHGATHITKRTSTWIDIMLVDENDVPTEVTNIPSTYNNSHNIIGLSLDLKVIQPPPNILTYRDFKGIDADELVSVLLNADWSAFEDPDNDVDGHLSCLNSILRAAIDKLAPIKNLKIKKGNYPWIDDNIKFLRRRRDATYRRYKRTNDSLLLDQYLHLRKQTDELTEKARTDYIHNKLYSITNSAALWKELRNLGLIPKPKDDLHGFSLRDLNVHFTSISVSDSESQEQRDHIIQDAPLEGFKFRDITLLELKNAISHFSSQAIGVDGVPQSVIAKALPAIGSHILKIFNTSLSTGVFPSLWKEAQVMPLKKVRAPTAPTDFRPISLLCFLSKVFEKVVHAQLIEYLDNNSLLDDMQTGFRKDHSTETALLKLIEDI